jgi:hypothetical protein
MCTDPAFPYCDVDGAIGGTPGACIAAPCVAGTFGKCDGSNALVCNQQGEGYDPISCINGCAGGSGCITCTANSQSCANGTQLTCDASGALSTTMCPLGCGADGTACAIYIPSNNLETYFDMTASPADLDLEAGTIELDGSTFTTSDGMMTTTLPSFDMVAPAGGAPLRVFVVKKLTLGNITITSTTAETAGSSASRAAAFLATDQVDVIGTVIVQTGALSRTGCTGNAGSGDKASMPSYLSGGGGGGNATNGANGGAIVGKAAGGMGGSPAGDDELVPLVGGCPGGAPSIVSAGGALQLMSRISIDVSGAITVDGQSGGDSSGGGAGGGLLLEAPVITVEGTAFVLARGGGGGSGNGLVSGAQLNGSAIPGGTCSPVSPTCADGGDGAAGSQAMSGGALTIPASGSQRYSAGAGGGGLGRIRFNTADGTFLPAGTAVIVGSVTNAAMLTN